MGWNEIDEVIYISQARVWDGTLTGKNLLPQREQILYSKGTMQHSISFHVIKYAFLQTMQAIPDYLTNCCWR